MDANSIIKVTLPTQAEADRLKAWLIEENRPEDEDACAPEARALFEYLEFADEPLKIEAIASALLIYYDGVSLEDFGTGRNWKEVCVLDDDEGRFADMANQIESMSPLQCTA